MAALIRRHGAEAAVTPSMQEVPLKDNTPVIQYANTAIQGDVDVSVFLTGVGAKAIERILRDADRFEDFTAALRAHTVIARGPKPLAVLRSWDLKNVITVPSPNTWRELIAVVDGMSQPIRDKLVCIQEYGVPNQDLIEAMKARGARTDSVPVYAWQLPDDTRPLEVAIRQIVRGDFAAVLFTSANQARNVLTVAERMGATDDLMSGLRQTAVCSIGPTCSETLQALGITVRFEASPPKLGALVSGAMTAINP